MCRQPSSPLFPYTTLFRSNETLISINIQNFPDAAIERMDPCSSFTDFAPGSFQYHDGRFLGDHQWIRQLSGVRSEEHTSELQSRGHLVCRLLLDKKNSIPG